MKGKKPTKIAKKITVDSPVERKATLTTVEKKSEYTMCEKLEKIIKPVYGKNFCSLLAYDTIYTSNDHHMVENRPTTKNFIADSLIEPQRADPCRYEILVNSKMPPKLPHP